MTSGHVQHFLKHRTMLISISVSVECLLLSPGALVAYLSPQSCLLACLKTQIVAVCWACPPSGGVFPKNKGRIQSLKPPTLGFKGLLSSFVHFMRITVRVVDGVFAFRVFFVPACFIWQCCQVCHALLIPSLSCLHTVVQSAAKKPSFLFIPFFFPPLSSAMPACLLSIDQVSSPRRIF